MGMFDRASLPMAVLDQCAISHMKIKTGLHYYRQSAFSELKITSANLSDLPLIRNETRYDYVSVHKYANPVPESKCASCNISYKKQIIIIIVNM